MGKAGVKEDFPGGPVDGSLPSSAGDVPFILGQGTKTPHPGQGRATKHARHNCCRASQLEKSQRTTMESLACCNWDLVQPNKYLFFKGG